MILSSFILLNENVDILNDSEIFKELSEQDKSAYESYISDSDKLAYIGARFLLRELGCKLKRNFKISEIRYTSLGKPYASGLPFISISHSSSYCVVAISQTSNIGIDVQRHIPINIEEYKTLLSNYELEQLNRLNNTEQTNCFYRFWTTKEAIMKADGRGFHLDPTLITKENDAYLIKDTGRYYYKLATPKLDGYSITMVSDIKDEKIKWYNYKNGLMPINTSRN